MARIIQSPGRTTTKNLHDFRPTVELTGMDGELVLLWLLIHLAVFAGPTLSRKLAAMVLRQVLRWEKRRALTHPERPADQAYRWHRKILKGPGNMVLETIFQLTDFLHGVAWVLMGMVVLYLAGQGNGWESLGVFLMGFAGSYLFLCLFRWPYRRLVQGTVNFVRRRLGKPTLPFFQETLMLWHRLANEAYRGLQLAPEELRKVLHENVKSGHKLVYEDALARLHTYGYPHEWVSEQLNKLLLSPYVTTQSRGALMVERLVPDAYKPSVLARLLTAKAQSIRVSAWAMYDDLQAEGKQQTALNLLEILDEELRSWAQARWLIDHPLVREKSLRQALQFTGIFEQRAVPESSRHALEGFFELQQRHPFSAEQTLALLASATPLIRFYATQVLAAYTQTMLRALASANPEEAFPLAYTRALNPRLLDDDQLVVTGAAEALAAAGHRVAAYYLLKTLKETDGSSQTVTLVELLELCSLYCQAHDLPELYPYAVSVVPEVQEAAARIFSHLGKPAISYLVTQMEQETDPARLERLLRMCSRLQSPAALGIIFQLQSHPNETLRRNAEEVARELLTTDGLTGLLPRPGLNGSVSFKENEYQDLLDRKDVRLLPRLIALYIGAPRVSLRRNPLKGRRALAQLIEATLQKQAELLRAYPALYCKRCLAPAERIETPAWQTDGKPWRYVRCQRCLDDRFLAPGIRRIVGYVGHLPEDAHDSQTLYLPLWDAQKQTAQHAYATLHHVVLAGGLDGPLDWAVSAVVNALRNSHRGEELPRWEVDPKLVLHANTQRLLQPFVDVHATEPTP